jgi:ABC-type nitrate/sulfonate/bicarbonate transport system permease component
MPDSRSRAPAREISRALSRDRLAAARKFLPAIVLLAAIVAVWEISMPLLGVSANYLPAPSRILRSAAADSANLMRASIISVEETLLGAALGIVSAIVLAFAIYRWPIVNRSLYPLLIISQTIPVVALAPLMIIWLGFGILPKVLLVALYTFFPIAVALVRGLDYVGEGLVNLSKTMGASDRWVLLHVRAMAALPYFFSGLRIGATYAIGTAILAEFVGARYGLGIYLLSAKASYRIDLVFAASAVTTALTLALFGVVVAVERIAAPWSAPAKEAEND